MRTIVKWQDIQYFKASDPWGDTSKVKPDLIYLIDEFRHFVGKPFILHNAYEMSGHSKGSQHYLGNALDGHFVGMHWLDQYLMALKFGKFNGIGVYPEWNNPGLHLDIRDIIDNQKVTWIEYKGEYNYNVNSILIIDVITEMNAKIKKTSKKEKGS